MEEEIEEVYEEYATEIPPIYHQLAQLPFHLIVNTTPDDFMVRALKEAGKRGVQEAWYNFQIDSVPELQSISSENPLVYNLFGSMRDTESLVLTEKDQVDFIKNIVLNEPPVPPRIMREFNEQKAYLFLEFDLRNWHFRLLLDGLNLTDRSITFAPKFSKADFDRLTYDYYEQSFQFQFVNQNYPILR